MPVQNYNINIDGDYVGNVYGMTYTNSVRESFRAAVEVEAGQIVKRGTGDREVTPGSAGAGNQFGVVIRQRTTESDFRPNTGKAPYVAGAIVPILLEGSISVRTVAAAVRDGAVYVHSTTGAVTSAPTTDYVKAANMKFASSGGAGEIVRVVITIAMINGTAV